VVSRDHDLKLQVRSKELAHARSVTHLTTLAIAQRTVKNVIVATELVITESAVDVTTEMVQTPVKNPTVTQEDEEVTAVVAATVEVNKDPPVTKATEADQAIRETANHTVTKEVTEASEAEAVAVVTVARGRSGSTTLNTNSQMPNLHSTSLMITTTTLPVLEPTVCRWVRTGQNHSSLEGMQMCTKVQWKW
jgi:hypothetical protein